MTPSASILYDGQIDERILALSRYCPRVMFPELAQTLHDCMWHLLFAALGQLQHERRIDLVAYQWDYEIRFLTAGPHSIAASRAPSEGQREHHEKRTA